MKIWFTSSDSEWGLLTFLSSLAESWSLELGNSHVTRLSRPFATPLSQLTHFLFSFFSLHPQIKFVFVLFFGWCTCLNISLSKGYFRRFTSLGSWPHMSDLNSPDHPPFIYCHVDYGLSHWMKFFPSSMSSAGFYLEIPRGLLPVRKVRRINQLRRTLRSQFKLFSLQFSISFQSNRKLRRRIYVQ